MFHQREATQQWHNKANNPERIPANKQSELDALEIRLTALEQSLHRQNTSIGEVPTTLMSDLDTAVSQIQQLEAPSAASSTSWGYVQEEITHALSTVQAAGAQQETWLNQLEAEVLLPLQLEDHVENLELS